MDSFKKNPNFQNPPDEGDPKNLASTRAILQWRAPEYQLPEKDRKWHLYMGLALLAIIAFAVYTNSPIMAITFILIGVVGYIFLNKEPEEIDFMITDDGIAAGREIYEFENMKSFWIFYEPGGRKIISFRMNNSLLPFVHIPIGNQNPVAIREILMKFIPEVRQDPSLVDAFERMIGL